MRIAWQDPSFGELATRSRRSQRPCWWADGRFTAAPAERPARNQGEPGAPPKPNLRSAGVNAARGSAGVAPGRAAIDEDRLDQFSRWLWPRDRHTRLLRLLCADRAGRDRTRHRLQRARRRSPCGSPAGGGSDRMPQRHRGDARGATDSRWVPVVGAAADAVLEAGGLNV